MWANINQGSPFIFFFFFLFWWGEESRRNLGSYQLNNTLLTHRHLDNETLSKFLSYMTVLSSAEAVLP